MMEIVADFFSNTPHLGPLDVLINIIFAGLMSLLVRAVYIRYGKSLSNRKHFSSSFLLITICTTLIIALIQSSIALSLGLVGALSIIRFRTAIKEPQELTYIFLCIAIGLGFGANERILTLSAGLLILAILVIISFKTKNKIEEAYNLTIKSRKLELDEVVSLSGEYCKRVDLRRFDDT
ncbi:MAG: DUF4956 domain-containing protein, partial [Clostridiales bacterium]|nr:DUF4956 domain-containing protein [Clostridiales bacterium]